MVYAYDSQGSLPDTRSAAELFEARERALQRWKAAHTRYVLDSSEAKFEIEAIDMEYRRRWAEADTVRFSDPRGPGSPMGRMRSAPSMPLRPHVSPHVSGGPRPEQPPRNGRMRLEGLNG